MVRQRGLSEGEECPMPIQEAVGASPPHTSPIPGPQSVREVLGLLAEEAQGDGSAGRGGSEAACWACPAEGASGLHPVVGEVEGRLEESGQGPQEGVQSGAEEAGGGVGTLGKGATCGRWRSGVGGRPPRLLRPAVCVDGGRDSEISLKGDESFVNSGHPVWTVGPGTM